MGIIIQLSPSLDTTTTNFVNIFSIN